MKHPTSLEETLASLSIVQHQAVSWEMGALLVLAGPGSGKTRVLTTRIARLLHESPSETFRIAALTFTNRAADEMRERVERMAPEAGERLFVGTFHAFSAELLRQHGQHLGLKTDFRVYSTDDDRAEIARRAIASTRGQAAGLFESDAKFLPLVDRAKAQLIPSENVAQKFNNSERGEKFEAFYAAYDAELTAANALDFNSLVYYAYQVFVRFPALAHQYQSVYRYWCIDEFQDTNNAQYHLLKVMAGASFREVFAVADDDQIIYQWNGADYRRLDHFRADFDADLLQIPTNFRCPPEVVSCANKLIACNLLRNEGKNPLIAGRKISADSSVVEILKFSSDEDEAKGVAKHIADYHGKALDQTVVLARVRRLLQPFADQLSALGISAQVVVRRDEFQSAEYNWLHNALRLAVHKTDDRVFAAFIGAFNEMFGCAISDTEIVAQAQADRLDLFSGWSRIAHADIANPDALELVDAAARLNQGNLDHATFSASVIRVFDSWLTDEKPEGNDSDAFSDLEDDHAAWHALSAEVGRAIGTPSDLESFLQELDLRSKEPPVGPDTVHIMTIHGAKGNEFDHVYVVGLAEDMLPGYYSKQKGDQSPQFEEERRNCFVAVTRCKMTLTLCYGERYAGWPKTPSRFLTEMGLSLPDGSAL